MTASWMSDALCTQVDPDLFFPDESNPATRAKSICVKCKVLAECLQFALENNEQHGIYGGLTVRERRALKRAAA